MSRSARTSVSTRRWSRSTRRGASWAMNPPTAGGRRTSLPGQPPRADRGRDSGALDRELRADLGELQGELVFHPLQLPALPDPRASLELPRATPRLTLVIDHELEL